MNNIVCKKYVTLFHYLNCIDIVIFFMYKKLTTEVNFGFTYNLVTNNF